MDKEYFREYYIKNKEKINKQQKEYRKIYFSSTKNKEEHNKKSKKYYKENSKEIMIRRKDYLKEWSKKNADKVRGYRRKTRRKNGRTYRQQFYILKYGARKRNLEVDITYELFYQVKQQKCSYCGEKDVKKIGIDRIDSSKGYLRDNITSCCKTCNIMKMQHDKNFFIKHINKIYEFNKKKSGL